MSGKTSQRWIEVQVSVPEELRKPVRELLDTFSGASVKEAREEVGDLWLVTGVLQEDTTASEKIKKIEGALQKLERKEGLFEPLSVNLEVVEPPERNPNLKTEGSFFIGRRFAIFPSGDVPVPVEGRMALSIATMHAFGDGSHPSTVLALRLLEDVLEGQMGELPEIGWVLDAGCGTGILSLAASALGPYPVLGIDVSAEAIVAARENQKKNGALGRKVQFVQGGFQSCRGPFSLVVANLVASVHTGAYEILWEVTEPGGWFVLAGFSSAQKSLVTTPYLEKGAVGKSYLHEGAWAGVVLRKPIGA